jgi:tyrosinase
MTTSRREVLLQGAVIGAGVIAANTTGMEAWAQGAPPAPKLRRSLHGMALNDPILQTWRDGVRLLKAASGNVSWASFAAIHGNDNGFNLCPHGNWYFLPWHRGYILMYERAVRQLTGNNDFALPYWDWTLDQQMPQAFTDQTFNGQPNPLFEQQRDATPTDSLPDSVVGQSVINQILTQAPFETFGTSRPNGQNNVDQSWINCEFCGTQGTLESNPHNNVHNFVGGIMAGAGSSRDPIFMMHHCNIDRIWWLWTQGGGADTPDPLWSGMTIQNNFFNPDGTSFSPRVSDLETPAPRLYLCRDADRDRGAHRPNGGDRHTIQQIHRPLGDTDGRHEASRHRLLFGFSNAAGRHRREISGDPRRCRCRGTRARGRPPIAAERLRDAEPHRRPPALSQWTALFCFPA